ncbi:MAG TPA: hypothetical protein HPP94_16645 [Desulfuromonadales bacterium]|nr:hypothetical protein [Desulfuromonadales bacterium]
MNPKLRAYIIVIITLVITLGPMLYGNIRAKKGGVLDDPLLDRANPYAVANRTVEGLVSQGLKSGDTVSFILPFEGGISRDYLIWLKKLSDRVKEAFPEYGVISPAIAARYRDNGTELLNRPYLHDDLINDPGFDLTAWQRELKRDPGVYGVLIGRNFDYGVVTLLLPVGYDEIGVFRRVGEFLEQRNIPLWEWSIKTDIKPAAEFSGVMPAGWVVARGLMDAALMADNMKLTSIGLIIAGLAFYLSLRSVRQALISSLVILIAFVWVRGSLGLLQMVGFELYELVYVLVVYTAVIISGISFTDRKFNAFNEAREAQPTAPLAECWKHTVSVNKLVLLTALIAVLNFGTLYQIQIRGILEVGVLSALGIIYLVLLTLWFLPALHFIIGGESDRKGDSLGSRLGERWNKGLKLVVERCYRFLDHQPHPHPNPLPEGEGAFVWQSRARQMTMLTIGVTLLAIAVISLDYLPGHESRPQMLPIKTRPMDFIRDTIVYKANDYLNAPGRYGFDRLSWLVRPKTAAPDGTPVSDPEFIRQVERFKLAVAGIPQVREVNGASDMLGIISRESHKLPLPATRQQAHDALQTIEWDLGPQVKEQLWYDGGMVLFASSAMEDSVTTRTIHENVMALATRDFPRLEVIPFGKLAIYPQADTYICLGKPLNVFSSQWIVFVICAVWVWWRNRKPRPHPEGDGAYPFRYSFKMTPRRQGGSDAGVHGTYVEELTTMPTKVPLEGETELSGWRAGLAMNMPFLFASALIALVMVTLRVPLDQATACITALAINAAIDFGLYLTADYQSAILAGSDLRGALQASLLDRGKIIVVDIVLNSLCFLPLVTSSFVPVARLGWVMVVMLLACGFGALVILPALLPWCVRQKP